MTLYRYRRNCKGQAVMDLAANLIGVFMVIGLLAYMFAGLAATATIYMEANNGAHSACTAPTFSNAVTQVSDAHTALSKGALGYVLNPIASADGTGYELEVVSMPTSGGPPDHTYKSQLPRVDNQHYYIWRVTAKYKYNGITIPGVGPVGGGSPIQFTATSMVEHPEGLTQ